MLSAADAVGLEKLSVFESVADKDFGAPVEDAVADTVSVCSAVPPLFVLVISLVPEADTEVEFECDRVAESDRLALSVRDSESLAASVP